MSIEAGHESVKKLFGDVAFRFGNDDIPIGSHRDQPTPTSTATQNDNNIEDDNWAEDHHRRTLQKPESDAASTHHSTIQISKSGGITTLGGECKDLIEWLNTWQTCQDDAETKRLKKANKDISNEFYAYRKAADNEKKLLVAAIENLSLGLSNLKEKIALMKDLSDQAFAQKLY
jgi:hypothetical protein